jgi:hypothetical protein
VVKKRLRHGQICPLRIKHVEFEPASVLNRTRWVAGWCRGDTARMVNQRPCYLRNGRVEVFLFPLRHLDRLE